MSEHAASLDAGSRIILKYSVILIEIKLRPIRLAVIPLASLQFIVLDTCLKGSRYPTESSGKGSAKVCPDTLSAANELINESNKRKKSGLMRVNSGGNARHVM